MGEGLAHRREVDGLWAVAVLLVVLQDAKMPSGGSE
jgi:hypothetical protein